MYQRLAGAWKCQVSAASHAVAAIHTIHHVLVVHIRPCEWGWRGLRVRRLPGRAGWMSGWLTSLPAMDTVNSSGASVALCAQTGRAGKCQHRGGLIMDNNLMRASIISSAERLYLDSGVLTAKHASECAPSLCCHCLHINDTRRQFRGFFYTTISDWLVNK